MDNNSFAVLLILFIYIVVTAVSTKIEKEKRKRAIAFLNTCARTSYSKTCIDELFKLSAKEFEYLSDVFEEKFNMSFRQSLQIHLEPKIYYDLRAKFFITQ